MGQTLREEEDYELSFYKFLTVYSSREHVGCQKGNKQMWEIYQVHSELLQTIYVRTAEQAEAVQAVRASWGSRAVRQPGC